jgi:hypothetical protein
LSITGEGRRGTFIASIRRRSPVAEAARVLRPGGILLTQQVGSNNDEGLNQALGALPPDLPDPNTGETTAARLESNGFEILTLCEEWPDFSFHDIGAVIYQLRAVSWQIPDFNVERYDGPLRALDARIRREGPLVVQNHRHLIKARLK